MPILMPTAVRATVWTRLLAFALSLAVMLLAVAPLAVLADDVWVDGDAATSTVSDPLNFGDEVCLGTTPSKSVTLAVSRQANANAANVFANSATLTWTRSIAGALSATVPSSSTLPSNWTTRPFGTLGGATSSSVTLGADLTAAEGSFSATVTYTATGARHNTPPATGSRSTSITVNGTVISCDEDPPLLSLPADMQVEATGASGATVSFTATASDANPTNPAVICSPASGSTFALGITVVNCSATDAIGNVANGSFNITVVDTTAPSLSGTPADISLEATNGTGEVVNYTNPTASDLVDGSVNVACAPASGSTFPLGPNTVTCSATDNAGNTGQSQFTITVSDTTAPTLVLPADITEEATSASGAAVSYTASASDLVDGDLAPNCTPASGNTFALGTQAVDCSVTDNSGNSASGSFNVTVEDTTAPALSGIPANITEEATGPTGAIASWTAPTASDLVDGSVDVACASGGGLESGDTFPLGETTVTCSATDNAGNTGSADFTVTVQDTTAPDLSIPADQPLEATGPGGAAASWVITATDIVDGAITPGCDATPGDTFPLGETTVNCSVTDEAGNTANGSFKIVVQDTTPPTVLAPADQIAEATGPSGAAVTYSGASASDLVDGSIEPTCVPASGSTFALGATTVTCSATDVAGNTGSADFTVTVQDTTPPTVIAPADQVAEATGPSGAAVSYSGESASDLVDGSIEPTCAPPSDSTFALGATTVTCSATDVAGNTGSATFTVTVQDTTGPALSLPANMTVAGTGASGAPVSYTASATDLVDGAVEIACTPPSGSIFGFGTTTVNCSATDSSGNGSNGSFTIAVQVQLSGFYQPVDMSGVWNTIKGGSTVPLKFEIFAGSTELTNLAYVTGFSAAPILCPTGIYLADPIEVLATGGTSLRYDGTSGQFIYNWQTPKKAGSCYVMTMTTLGGSTLQAKFMLK